MSDSDAEPVPTVTVTRDQLTAILTAILDDEHSTEGRYYLGSDKTFGFGRQHFVKPETLAIVLMGRLRAAGCPAADAAAAPRRGWRRRR